MELGLADKVALVTGAGSQKGFGKGIAMALAKEGCDMIILDLDIESLKKTEAEIKSLGNNVLALNANITNNEEVVQAVEKALEKFGKIDILVNNAGISRDCPILETDEEMWHINVETNLKGTWYVTRAVLPQMISRKSGKIINLSSGGARVGFMNASLYLAAKSGIIGFTTCLAVELGPSGINVNGIAPGLGDTGLWGEAGFPNEIKAGFESSVPMGRLTKPQDIGNMVVFLASDASSDITGQTIQVDGGAYRL